MGTEGCHRRGRGRAGLRHGLAAPALGLLLLACGCGSAGIRVDGPGTEPHLGFACCEHGIAETQALFADPAVIPALHNLHATVAVALPDFSAQRAAVVRRLNQAGIPVVAWILLPPKEGVYLNADNVPAAQARVAAFEQWTGDEHLRWSAVGLDIEPDFQGLAALRGHRLRLAGLLVKRSFQGGRIRRAQQAYTRLVAQLQAQGYSVETYQMPYVPAERSVHSSLPDRLLGTAEVSGNENYLMLYTSMAKPVGAAMIWSLGPHAEDIAIGSTDGAGALDWSEFARDLIVAGHFTRQIGVYDLEGCVRQGFLPRLESMDWSRTVVIPAAGVRRAEWIGGLARAGLWIATNLLWLAALVLVLLGVWIARSRKTGRGRSPAPGDFVVLEQAPEGLLRRLPESDQHAIRQILGKPVRLLAYDDHGRAELEFTGSDGTIHLIYVNPETLRIA